MSAFLRLWAPCRPPSSRFSSLPDCFTRAEHSFGTQDCPWRILRFRRPAALSCPAFPILTCSSRSRVWGTVTESGVFGSSALVLRVISSTSSAEKVSPCGWWTQSVHFSRKERRAICLGGPVKRTQPLETTNTSSCLKRPRPGGNSNTRALFERQRYSLHTSSPETRAGNNVTPGLHILLCFS